MIRSLNCSCKTSYRVIQNSKDSPIIQGYKMLTGSQREQLFIRTSPAGGGPGAAGAGAARSSKHVIEN